MDLSYSQINIIFDASALLILFVIWFAGSMKTVELNNKHLFLTMMVSASTCLGADAVSYALMGHSNPFFWYAALFSNTVYFSAQAIFCWQWFLYALGTYRKQPLYIKNIRNYIYAVPMIAELIIVILINPFTEIIFNIDSNACYHRANRYFIILIIQYLYVLAAIVLLFMCLMREHERKKKSKYILLFLLSSSPVMCSLVQLALNGISIMWPATAISVYIMFEIEAHAYMEAKAVREAELEAQVAKNKITVMMSQIQPHFLYNTLTTIRALVGRDPARAQEVIASFAAYLRTNMDSMNLTAPVPFSKELEHTMTYTEIEQLRFPDLIVEYDIKDKNFLLPALSVQPMVENAIKHGIRKRTEPGGKVTIKTYKSGASHIVEITDNGAGFSDDTPKDPTRSHIGLMNTKSRIEEMMHGEFIIKSEKNVGTTISFVIPEYEED